MCKQWNYICLVPPLCQRPAVVSLVVHKLNACLVPAGLSWHIPVSASLVKSLLQAFALVHNTMRALCCICWTCFAHKICFVKFYHKTRAGERCYAINSLLSLNEITGQSGCKDLLSPVSCFLCLAPLTTCSARQGIARKITVKKDSFFCFLFRCTLLLLLCFGAGLCAVPMLSTRGK